jgi:hypothetical protein
MNDDCILSILSFLDIININNISLVNKQFNILSKNDFIWRKFYDTNFNGISCTRMFYDNYKVYYLLKKIIHTRNTNNETTNNDNNINENTKLFLLNITLKVVIQLIILIRSQAIECDPILEPMIFDSSLLSILEFMV